MNEADEVFNVQISMAHVQREKMEKFAQLCKEGKAISGISEEELASIIQDLNNDEVSYSNDMVVDMIIKYVLENTNEEKLTTILGNIKIANVERKEVIGSAYPQYMDGSYYVEIGEDIEKRICLLSDVFAVLFMFNEKLVGMENVILCELLKATKNRYFMNEEFTEDFNSVQVYMMICDNTYKDDFTDRYIAYAREIYEMAIAFLIGHEIGHHYYGDTIGKPKQGMERKIAELKADAFALDFAFKYLENSYPNKENIYGIHFFAGTYVPLIASASICKNIFEDGENYPSILKRLLGVQKGLQKILTLTSWEETKKYRDFLLKIIQFPLPTN